MEESPPFQHRFWLARQASRQALELVAPTSDEAVPDSQDVQFVAPRLEENDPPRQTEHEAAPCRFEKEPVGHVVQLSAHEELFE